MPFYLGQWRWAAEGRHSFCFLPLSCCGDIRNRLGKLKSSWHHSGCPDVSASRGSPLGRIAKGKRQKCLIFIFGNGIG